MPSSKPFRNAAALYLLQGLNVVVPLLTIPYLIRVLEIDGFGRVTYAFSVAQLAVFLTEFSFNLTATRSVATSSNNDANVISQVYSVVTVLKGLIGGVAGAAFAIAVALIPPLRDQWQIYLALLPMLVGEVLLPIWLFHGLQKMSYLPVMSIVGRGLGLAAMVWLVRSPNDLAMAAFVQALPFLATGIVAQFVLHFRLGVAFAPRQPLALYLSTFRESAQVFLARLAAQVYTRGAIVMLGAFASPAEVGYFSVAQRISALLVSAIVTPVTQSLYPHLCTVWETQRHRVWVWRRWLLGGAVTVSAVALAILNIGSTQLAILLTGDATEDLSLLLLVFSPAIALTVLNVVLSTLITAMRRYSEFTRVLGLGAVVFLTLGLALTPSFGALGMAVTSVVVEGVVFVACIYATRANYPALTEPQVVERDDRLRDSA